MTPSDLYERIKITDSLELLTFLNESNNAIRLTFLRASSNPDTNTAFQGIIRVLAQKQLATRFIATSEIQSLYTHLAFYFKKENKRAFVDACTTHIHESVFKRRLSAWLHQKRYHNHNSHITEFRNYLTKLSAARIDDDEDYTYEILSDLYDYRFKTVNSLPSDVRENMEELFANEDVWNEFPIVRQLHLEDLDQLPDLTVVEYAGKEYIPSEFAEDLFNRMFIDYVKHKKLFGYGIVEATEQVIKKGQANFDEVYEELSARDVVKIYCYCNMRMHYYSSLCLYERSELVAKFYNTNGRIKFIDIGCGPATGGLAFAEHIYDLTGEAASFDYWGIDTSQTMQDQAREIMVNNIFLDSNHSSYFKQISQITISKLSGASCIILNACYVFASPSLSLSEIVEFIKEVKKRYPYTPKFLLFQNPIGDRVNRRYREFKGLLEDFEEQFSEDEEIKYYNQRRWRDKAKERGIYYEILKL